MDRAAQPTNHTAPTRAGSGRLALAMLAGAVLSIAGGRVLAPQEAEAQRSVRHATGILNPADQRNEMIQELKKIGAKLAELEKSFDSTLDVNVLTMPASFNATASNGD